MKTNKIQALILFIAVIAAAHSCANTSTPPSGGPKDTLAPVLLKVLPDSNKTLFPRKGGKVELRFDEYVVIKDAIKYVYLSPPQKKMLETKIKGKSVVVTFPEELDSATTYSINFSSSISDNNEGNLFYPYVYPFSTGSTIDTMVQSGTVMNYKTLLPIENVLVGYYTDIPDSSISKTYPSVMTKSDKWGYYIARYLKSSPYRVIAFKDDNNNNLYDSGSELVGFLDSLQTPILPLTKGMKETEYVMVKDTLKAMSRPYENVLYMFKEVSGIQYIKDSKRPQRRMAYITFGAPGVRIDSMGFRGIDSSKVLSQFNITKDSLVLWIKDTLMIVPDTMYFDIKYYKTDTLKKLVLERESVKLISVTKKRSSQDIKLSSGKNKQSEEKKEKRKDLLELKIEAEPSMIEQLGYKLIFPALPVKIKVDSIKLLSLSPKGIKGEEEYTFVKDSVENLWYYVRFKNKVLPGFTYTLSIPEKTFTDVYRYTNDSIDVPVILPNTDKLAQFTLNITGTNGSHVVELTNQTRDKVFRTYKILNDTVLVFPYIQPGIYNIRITQDLNGNGILDTGNLIERRQPEKVRLMTLPTGKSLIELKEGMEIEQSVNLKEIFK
ncbi:MAG: Ig-like domain-containing protein [Rikenellaceae bacterium]|nr:Ig-like domain-containing protein [Rikenellaceae bacterium]